MGRCRMELAWDVESTTRLPASTFSVSREKHFVRFSPSKLKFGEALVSRVEKRRRLCLLQITDTPLIAEAEAKYPRDHEKRGERM